jgi:hypothetical protein
MIHPRLPALALIAALAGASAVQAQDAPSTPGAPAAHRAWDPAQFRARMEARRAERLKALHDVLAIRPDQESAFQAFAAAVRPPERTPGDHPGGKGGDRAQLASLTTPERLDHMAQRMQERTQRRQAAFTRRAEATKALYSALSPEQRRTMDALPLLRGGHEGRGGWGKGRGHWGGHGMEDRGQG